MVDMFVTFRTLSHYSCILLNINAIVQSVHVSYLQYSHDKGISNTIFLIKLTFTKVIIVLVTAEAKIREIMKR